MTAGRSMIEVMLYLFAPAVMGAVVHIYDGDSRIHHLFMKGYTQNSQGCGLCVDMLEREIPEHIHTYRPESNNTEK